MKTTCRMKEKITLLLSSANFKYLINRSEFGKIKQEISSAIAVAVAVTTAGHVVLAVDDLKGALQVARGDDRHCSGLSAATDEPGTLANQASSHE